MKAPAIGDFVEYTNVPRMAAMLISSRLATLHELQTIYGLEDLMMMLEVICVDNHNQGAAKDGNGN